MADTIPAIVLQPGVPVDVFAETGIPVGTGLLVNVYWTEDVVNAYIQNTAPVKGDSDRIGLFRRDQYKLDANESGLWLLSTSPSQVTIQLD